uniref:Anaphase-promoting complex subunit 4 WD40 domain-containing protein n=1 Tax=Araucaria cunninghamii TaxID=56994 RepID=A0A0D6R8J9_ARACU
MGLNEEIVRGMSIGAVFKDYKGKISSLDFHRKEDLLVTASHDDSIRLYDTANAVHQKTVYDKKHGVDLISFTHHPSSVICSSRNSSEESLQYLSLYDNRILRYFKGHRGRVTSLCMSPINDSFMSGSMDRSVRLWDLRVNACQPTVAYDQQGLVFAVAMEGGAIKLFDSRYCDKGPFDTFLVGGDTAEVSDIKFSSDGTQMLLTTTNSHVYILDAYAGKKRCGFVLEPCVDNLEACFSPDGQFVLSGSGNGSLRAWNVSNGDDLGKEVALWTNHTGVPTALKWAPRRVMFASASSVLAFWIPGMTRQIPSNATNIDSTPRE